MEVLQYIGETAHDGSDVKVNSPGIKPTLFPTEHFLRQAPQHRDEEGATDDVALPHGRMSRLGCQRC